MLPSWERFLSTVYDLQRTYSPVASMSPSNTGERGTAELTTGRSASSPSPTQRGSCSNEGEMIRRVSHSEPGGGCRLGLYFHAHEPQPGTVSCSHSPTGVNGCADAVDQRAIRSLSLPDAGFSQHHGHAAIALNERKALIPTGRQHPSTPNEVLPLHHGSQLPWSSTYNNVNSSLGILIGILGIMKKDTPMYRIVNWTTMEHLVAILSLEDHAQIPEQVSNDHDKVKLLDFATYVWNKGPLRRTRLQDANRRTRCLIVGLGTAGTILPDALGIDCREVTQEMEPYAFEAYTDNFRGTYRDKRVTLRRFRLRGLCKDKCREVLLWLTLEHKNVLPFIGVYSGTDGHLITVSPFMENGTLLLWRLNSMPPASEIERCMREVAEGLQYLHNEGVIHGNVRGDNVHLDSNFRVRLGDLGSSLHSDALPSKTPMPVISYHFSAPELFSFEEDAIVHRTEKTDIFAFAGLYYQIHYGRQPFAGHYDLSIPQKVKQGTRARKLPDPPIDDRVWALIKQCWQQDPTQRPTMSVVLNDMRSWHLS